MKILIINSAEAKIREFVTPIEKILTTARSNAQMINYRECSNINLNSFDGIIVSGSPQGDDIVEHHQPYFQWLKTYKKPVLGICAGHHITGFMFGANYLRNVEPESGNCLVEVLKEDPLFYGLPKSLLVRQMHNDSITLPDQFIHLAQSTICFNQAMRHSNKPLYTLQFHPEFLNPEIILNFISICKKHED
ncbi:type 1 glutamine amidotransferase [Gaoshiqia sediminis]|uniref:Glutamine amidotransferase domain-containing protein n=1 Tax=Gaoshiqia sediminis TaxID=2986998 RepID=A0AA41Y6G4_9BACT|nr:hypothetical protein [Gaoshiqia sediminis]MCW0482814.1 hypothetical protein [Gaoshiqia sediminis]